MAKVTIEGTGSSVLLAKGERRTVALTEITQRRIDRGYFVVVERFDDEPTPPISEPDPSDSEDADTESEDGDSTEDTADDVPAEAPSKNASRKEWAAWFDAQEIGYPEDATRDQLAGAWEHVVQQRAQEQQ